MDLESFNIYAQFLSDLSDCFAPFLHSERWFAGAVIFAILLWLTHNRGLLSLVVDRLFLRMNITMAFFFSLLTILFLLGCIHVTDSFLEHCHGIYYQYRDPVKRHNDEQQKKKDEHTKKGLISYFLGQQQEAPASATSSPPPGKPGRQTFCHCSIYRQCLIGNMEQNVIYFIIPTAKEAKGKGTPPETTSSAAKENVTSTTIRESVISTTTRESVITTTETGSKTTLTQQGGAPASENHPSAAKPESKTSATGQDGAPPAAPKGHNATLKSEGKNESSTVTTAPKGDSGATKPEGKNDVTGQGGNTTSAAEDKNNAAKLGGRIFIMKGDSRNWFSPCPFACLMQPDTAGKKNSPEHPQKETSDKTPQPREAAEVRDDGQKPGKWNLNLVRHFLYIITPSSTLSQEKFGTVKFFIQVGVVYLGYLVLAGLVVSFLLYLLRNKLMDLERGVKRDYGYLTDHIVIIGSRDYLWKLIEHIENNQEEKPLQEWVPKNLRASWRDWRDRMQRFWDRLLDNETLSLFSQRKSILILTSRPAKDVRDELYMHLPRHLVRRTILTHGSCSDERVLRQLNIPKCRALYVIGEVLDESMDSMNLECIRTISRQVLPQPRRLTSSDKDTAPERKIPCHVYFERTATYALLQRGAFEPFRNLIFIPYCFHKNWIEKILCVSDPYLPAQQSTDDDEVHYLPLDREPITADSSKYVHLIVIGGSRMGLAMATEAAHLLHFPNFVSRKIKSRITLISSQIDERMLTLQNEVKPFFDYVEWEYKDLSGLSAPSGASQHLGNIIFRPEKDYIDQKWTFLKGDAHSARLQALMKEYASDPNALVTVAVCIANDRDASRIALNLPREFYKPGQEVPILVRQEAGAGLMHALHNTKTHNYDKVLPFGMRLDEFDLVQKNSDRRAMISWIVYRNTQRMHQDKRPCDDFTTFRERDKVESDVSDFFDVGTNQKMKWDDLSMRFKFANRYRAYLLWSYLRSLGKVDFKARNQTELDEDLRYLRDILLSNGELMGEVEHNRWNVEQLLLGKLPRPDNNTGGSDDIRDIDPYGKLKPINQWCRVNIMLFLYLQVKYYFEAKLRLKQREEAAKQD